MYWEANEENSVIFILHLPAFCKVISQAAREPPGATSIEHVLTVNS